MPPPEKKEADDESVLSLSQQTNRPPDLALHQQRIPAWHPILDPVWVIIALFYLGVIMIPVGACVRFEPSQMPSWLLFVCLFVANKK